MARNAQARNLVTAWGEGEPTNREEIPAALRLEGWDFRYSQIGGRVGPERKIVNQLLLELTSLWAEVNAHGPVLPWSAGVNYVHHAFVTGSDGHLYVSTASSGPATADAIDPTTPNSKWRLY